MRGADGLPNPADRRTFVAGAAAPIDLQVGPGGDLFYVDLDGGRVERIHATAGNRTPSAVATATPDHGPLPLHVAFSGSGSSDPDGDALTYAWDLDADGQFDDSTAAAPSQTFTTSGRHVVRLRVRDPSGLTSTAQLTVLAGTPPTASIGAPAAGTRWQVGDVLAYSGSGKDGSGAALPPSALSWTLDLHHCDALGNCHVHHVQSLGTGTSGTFTAPDHEYPSYLELVLRASAGGLSTSVSRRLDPRTVHVTVTSDPPGLEVAAGSSAGPGPQVREVIVGSRTSIGVTSPQPAQGRAWVFAGWSDLGAPAHDVVAPGTDTTYTARFSALPGGGPPPPGGPRPPAGRSRGLIASWGFEERSGTTARSARSGRAGHIHRARRTRHGRHGAGLALDGRGDSVTLPGPALRNAFTLEAWVRPDRRRGPVPVVTGERGRRTAFALDGTHARRWTHLALTWDGHALRRYVNGRRVGRARPAKRVTRGLSRLRFGADRSAGVWLDGRLDEVRVYDRALGGAALTADMARPARAG
jgi:PKD repeat protein